MRLCPLAAFLVLAIATASSAAVIFVDSSIQQAIDVANPGDEIVVLPGQYHEAIDFLGKDIKVHSASGPDVTTIDGAGLGLSCVTFRSGETGSAVLDGFTITRGEGTYYQNEVVGGGAFCLNASPTIGHCHFVDNQATYAAGIFVDFANPTIQDCEFHDNVALTYGGGIAGPDAVPTIQRCLFENNFCGSGDGTIHLALNSLIEDCTFRHNYARAGAAINSGGYGADFVVRNCVFEDNIAHTQHGGAIRIHEASPVVEKCLFVGNRAMVDGGAIITIDGGTATIMGCTFHNNGSERYGGSIAVWDGASPSITNCIVANGSSAGGLFCAYSSASLSCNDFWNNVGGNYTGDCPDQTGVNGNFSEDPLFCDPGGGNFGLQDDSPCLGGDCGLVGAFGAGCSPTDVSWQAPVAALRIQVAPNPVIGDLRYTLEVPQPTFAQVSLLTAGGREVYGVYEGALAPGIHRMESIALAAKAGLPRGVYFLRATTGQGVAATKLVIVR